MLLTKTLCIMIKNIYLKNLSTYQNFYVLDIKQDIFVEQKLYKYENFKFTIKPE